MTQHKSDAHPLSRCGNMQCGRCYNLGAYPGRSFDPPPDSLRQKVFETAAVPTPGNWPSFLGATVRCFFRGDSEPSAEGKVIAYCPVPTLVIERPDGTRFHHAIDLPLEVMEWKRVI